MKKKLVTIFLVLSSVTNLMGQVIRLHEVFWPLLWSSRIISVTPLGLLKSQIFEKKATFPEKKIKKPIFPALSKVKSRTQFLIGFKRVLWQPLCKL